MGERRVRSIEVGKHRVEVGYVISVFTDGAFGDAVVSKIIQDVDADDYFIYRIFLARPTARVGPHLMGVWTSCETFDLWGPKLLELLDNGDYKIKDKHMTLG